MNLSDQTDHDLLRQYAREGSQAAFAELVGRHVNLVYSAALRQVRSAALAEEVAQSVFLDLSRGAPGFPTGMPLVAWLHVVSRRTAIDVIRRESRRQAREHQAAEIAAMKPSSSVWDAVEPLLDEAVESLNESDRAAILLRYFENKSLRDVGRALGASENAAQKRVNRAVEQLRGFFLRRGIAVTAAGLATDLSAHALLAAPAGLSVTISTAAASGGTVYYTAPKATEAIAMTTIPKALITATLALVVGGTLYEARSVGRRGAELKSLEAGAGDLRREIVRIGRRNETATRDLEAARRALAAARAPAPPPEPGSDAALDSEMAAWMTRAARLKQLITQMPERAIPEMTQFLTNEEFFSIAARAQLDTDAHIRETLSRLRHSAKNTLGNKMPGALRAFLDAHDNELPADPQELAPYFDPPIDPAILERYKMAVTGKLGDVPARGRTTNLITERSAVDDLYDSRLTVGTQGLSLGAFDYTAAAARQALVEFGKANQGAKPADASQLLPYFDPPLKPAELQKFIQNSEHYLPR